MSKKISQLNELTTVLESDLLAVVHNGETRKVTKANLLKELQAGSFVDNEIPAGLIDGSNTVYTTEFDFITGSTRVYLNGLRLLPSDYSETGANEITLSDPLEDGDSLLLDYRK
jgi:hypothetical protein